MATKTGNTVVGPVMLHPVSRDVYSPENLMVYRTSLALFRNMVDEGIFDESEYGQIRTIITKKHGLSSDSIFAECA